MRFNTIIFTSSTLVAIVSAVPIPADFELEVRADDITVPAGVVPSPPHMHLVDPPNVGLPKPPPAAVKPPKVADKTAAATAQQFPKKASGKKRAFDVIDFDDLD